MNTDKFRFIPIGWVHNSYVQKSTAGLCIQLQESYKRGLKHLDKFSHIHVFSWFEADKPDSDQSGCFASLQLNRPVPIFSQIVKIKSVDNSHGLINIQSPVGMVDYTVIDIKPYMPVEDFIGKTKSPADVTIKYKLPVQKIKQQTEKKMQCQAIGIIKKEKTASYIEIFLEYRKGLKGLNDFSHIHVLWFFHRFAEARYRRIMQVNPPYEGPVTGVFATRSPVRPNPLALTNAKIMNIDFKTGIIEIQGLDAFNNTPVLDIKPYIQAVDCIPDTRCPQWQAHWPQQKNFTGSGQNNKIVLKKADIEKIILPKEVNHSQPKIINQNQDQFKASDTDDIVITGARQNNLKNITVKIPRQKLTVITGLSGSGKSSLAFDTLYAEGQRRYMQSLSSSSRQAVAILEKPDFDHMENLLPTIAIEQKTISHNPRSTVGTVSDIYNYLRLLYTKLGTRHCITCGRAIKPLSARELAEHIMELPGHMRIDIYCGKEVKQENLVTGFNVAQVPVRPKLKNLLQQTYKRGRGFITLMLDQAEIIKISQQEACPYCENLLFPMHISLFSFNSPDGMCAACNGLGVKQEVDINRIVNPEKSLLDGGAVLLGNLRKHRKNPNANWVRGGVLALAQDMKVDLELPWKSLPKEFKQKVLYGTGREKYSFTYNSKKTGRAGTITRPVEGMVSFLQRLLVNSRSRNSNEHLQHFLVQVPCDVCEGERLGREGRSVTLGGKRFPQAASATVEELHKWLKYLPSTIRQDSIIAQQIFTEIRQQLQAMMDLGLHYLTLDRAVTTLSGGEAQRIRLSSQLGCGLAGILYILDEPSIGLHCRDHGQIIAAMKNLRDQGNTVVVVEHDLDTMRQADYIIDLGPGAGANGGKIIAQGSPQQIIKSKDSVTADFLAGRIEIKHTPQNRIGNGDYIGIEGARLYNLKNICTSIPLGCITCITGVSGSGKSSLIRHTLVPAIKQHLTGATSVCGPFDSISGLEHIDKIVVVNQSPIGKSPRSNPATYIGLFDEIRTLFAHTPQAGKRKYTASRFSFNNKEGRCSACEGYGRKKVEMLFLPDVWITCGECNGQRYNEDTLAVPYKSKNIAQILNMDVCQALDFFADNDIIKSYLQILSDVGLAYIKLGQGATSLSGGEAQRIKLAAALIKPDTGRTLFVLDEPTTGLHPGDIQKLLTVLNRLADLDNTVIIIEHNLDVIRNADWIIDLGPEGGDAGGYIVAEGTPEEIIKAKQSYTGQALKR